MVDQVLALPEGTQADVARAGCRDRKGEHVQLMADLQAQGFIRARIDGEVYELDEPPHSTCARNTVSMRSSTAFKVKPDLRLRLAESFETALRLADGIARIALMDETGTEESCFPIASPAPSAATA